MKKIILNLLVVTSVLFLASCSEKSWSIYDSNVKVNTQISNISNYSTWTNLENTNSWEIQNITPKDDISIDDEPIDHSINSDIWAFKCGDNIYYWWYEYTTKLLPDWKCWTSKNMKHMSLSWGESWCYKDNDLNCDSQGRLYDFISAKKVCPYLWYWWNLPTSSDIQNLKKLWASSFKWWNKIFGIIEWISWFYSPGGFFTISWYSSRWLDIIDIPWDWLTPSWDNAFSLNFDDNEVHLTNWSETWEWFFVICVKEK
jgi:hypothetical protein